MFAQTQLIGRIGRIEFAVTKNGTQVAEFSVATDRNMKVNGGWTTETEWHNCKVYGNVAELMQKNGFEKGDLVQVFGEPRTRKYEKANVTFSVTEIHVNKYPMKMPGQWKTQNASSSAPYLATAGNNAIAMPAPTPTRAQAPVAAIADIPDDDLPF